MAANAVLKPLEMLLELWVECRQLGPPPSDSPLHDRKVLTSAKGVPMSLQPLSKAAASEFRPMTCHVYTVT